jgi:exodeoxyribonuclease VII large subunit
MLTMPDHQKPLSITALNTLAKRILENEPRLNGIWVEGEVSNLRKQDSGHVYFTLKDATAQINAVMWRTAAAKLRTLPQHGERVRAFGSVGLYEKTGNFQFYAEYLEPLATAGDLHAQFRRLWERLESEGLFDPALKRPLPPFPRRIGVVTSSTGAAFQDICNVLQRRYPLGEVLLSHTPVQGEDAPPHIIAALRRVDAAGADVILIARGGGSLEDLWCFNDEALARAIRQTRAPVVTGVGHETDTTLVDGVADRRAPTPSAGAELIAPSVAELRGRLRELSAALQNSAESAITNRRAALANMARTLRLVSPAGRIRSERQRLDELSQRLTRAAQAQLDSCRGRLRGAARALEAANPARLLARGYAIVTRAGDGKRLTDSQDAAPGTSVHIQLARGILKATVRERQTDDPPQEG